MAPNSQPVPPAPQPGSVSTEINAGRGDRFLKFAVAACFLVVLASYVWVISPRFSIGNPSIIDDWSALDNAPNALSKLAQLAYDPAEVGDPQRYRPSFLAVWNDLQWHTLGAPRHLLGPNLWNLLRLAIFIGALMLVPVMVLKRRMATDLDKLKLAVFSAALPLAIISTPLIGEDFARFGPGEPTLVSGMILGGFLLGAAVRRVIAGRARGHWRARLTTAAMFAGGYLLWLLGVYHKESSVCFLAMAPFIYLYLNRRWREERLIDRALLQYRSAQLTAGAMLIPVLHMAYEVKLIADGGKTVYGGVVPQGTGGLAQKLQDSVQAMNHAMNASLGTAVWHWIMLSLPVLIVAVALRNKRIPWLAIALTAGGAAAFAFQGLAGITQSRYYIPSLALFGVAFVLLTVRLRAGLVGFVIICAALFTLNFVDGSRGNVSKRAKDDREGGAAINALAAINPWRCQTLIGGMEQEPADAFPVLVDSRERPASDDCDGGTKYLVGRTNAALVSPVTNDRVFNICVNDWRPIFQNGTWTIWRCKQFKAGRMGGQAIPHIIEESRFVPGVRWTDRHTRLYGKLNAG
ncbi:MAG TPA: hypothetical protein VGO97_04075 [Solirubrobacterales bacterium]|nr:hypothetical protein [Solirubrobacterales bacterium]